MWYDAKCYFSFTSLSQRNVVVSSRSLQSPRDESRQNRLFSQVLIQIYSQHKVAETLGVVITVMPTSWHFFLYLIVVRCKLLLGAYLVFYFLRFVLARDHKNREIQLFLDLSDSCVSPVRRLSLFFFYLWSNEDNRLYFMKANVLHLTQIFVSSNNSGEHINHTNRSNIFSYFPFYKYYIPNVLREEKRSAEFSKKLVVEFPIGNSFCLSNILFLEQN